MMRKIIVFQLYLLTSIYCEVFGKINKNEKKAQVNAGTNPDTITGRHQDHLHCFRSSSQLDEESNQEKATSGHIITSHQNIITLSNI